MARRPVAVRDRPSVRRRAARAADAATQRRPGGDERHRGDDRTGLPRFARAEYLLRLATRITALASFALDGNAHHFDAALFEVKPHAGQQQVAAWLR